VADMSAIDALKKLTDKYEARSKKLILKNLSSDSRRMLGQASGFIEVNLHKD